MPSINKIRYEGTDYDILGEELADLEAETNTLKEDLNVVEDSISLDFAAGATWGQGAWVRGNIWETGELNGALTRVGTTIDIGYNNVVSVQLNVTDNSYSIEYYAFDSQHNSVGYNTTWQKNHNLFFAKGVRYIRIDMRKDDNSAVGTEISKYLTVNVNNSSDMKDVLFRKSDNIRLHILSHNAGAYNYGNTGGYGGIDVTEKVKEWKKMFNHYGADIVLLQENAAYFDSAHTLPAAATLLNPIYPFYIYEGNQALFVASKIPILNPETFDLSVEVGGNNYPRWARKGEITIGDVTICIVDAHFTPGTGAVYDNVRTLQWNKLNTLLANYKLIIIGGDFNTSNSEFITSIQNSGFTPVNCAYLGDIPTIGEQATDNILLKGFIPCKTECSSEYACTSDHYPLYSVVRLNTNSLY